MDSASISVFPYFGKSGGCDILKLVASFFSKFVEKSSFVPHRLIKTLIM